MFYATWINFYVLEKFIYVYQSHGLVMEWQIAMELKMSIMIPVVINFYFLKPKGLMNPILTLCQNTEKRCYLTFVGQRKCGEFMGVKSTSSPHPVNISYTKTPHIAQPHISSMGYLLRSCWPNPSHQILSGQNVGIYLKGCGEEIRPNSINSMRRYTQD